MIKKHLTYFTALDSTNLAASALHEPFVSRKLNRNPNELLN